MSANTPDKPTPTSDALRRLEALPSSTAGGTIEDLTALPGGRPEEPTPPSRSRRYALIGGGVLLAGVLVWLALGGPTLNVGPLEKTIVDDPIEAARKTLAEKRDLSACREVIDLVNSGIAANEKLKPPGLTAERREALKSFFGLPADAVAEADGNVYSKLDAAHLEQCLLFRDVARTLDPTKLPGVAEADVRERWLDRAGFAFGWAVRQVRLEQEPEAQRRIDPLSRPPGYVVRRGVGSPLERALVFLALLEQLGPPEKVRGCLVYAPEKDGAEPTLWAVGVQIDGKDDVYLFDPRLGLPVPGKDGQGVATLAAVVADPALLAPLVEAGPAKYTPSGDQVKKADLRLVASLSALAPRMAKLEREFLGAAVGVRLSQDAAAMRTAFDKAAKAAGLSGGAVAWSEGTLPNGQVALTGPELQRRFLSKTEGGSDDGQFLRLTPEAMRRLLINEAALGPQPFPRQPAWALSAVPFEYYPRIFTDPRRFPRTVGLGQRVYLMFASPFLRATEDSDGPREKVLRGRYSDAAPSLIRERDELEKAQANLKRALEQGGQDLQKKFDGWVDDAVALYANLETAKSSGNNAAVAQVNREIAGLWNRAGAVTTVLFGSVAGPRLSEITYQIALSKHEAAEAVQRRLDLAKALNVTLSKPELDQANNAWQDALGWWERYVTELPAGPDRSAVRRLQARALACVGNPDGAASLLRDATPPMGPLDQTAALYLAKMTK